MRRRTHPRHSGGAATRPSTPAPGRVRERLVVAVVAPAARHRALLHDPRVAELAEPVRHQVGAVVRRVLARRFVVAVAPPRALFQKRVARLVAAVVLFKALVAVPARLPRVDSLQRVGLVERERRVARCQDQRHLDHVPAVVGSERRPRVVRDPERLQKGSGRRDPQVVLGEPFHHLLLQALELDPDLGPVGPLHLVPRLWRESDRL